MHHIYKKSPLIMIKLLSITILSVLPTFYVSAQNVQNNQWLYKSNNNQVVNRTITQIKPQIIPPVAIEWSRKQQKLIAQNKATHQLSGISSYYGEKFHKNLTANGESFNMNDLTAAHRTLPFNTLVRVTNTINRKNVIVRINDRGPFLKNRVIDLSKAAAIEVGMLADGTAPVVLHIIQLGDNVVKKTSQVKVNPKAVQIASYSEEYMAQNLINTLLKHKIDSKIEPYNHYYRVVVPVNTSSIKKIKKQLGNLGYTNTLVRYK